MRLETERTLKLETGCPMGLETGCTMQLFQNDAVQRILISSCMSACMQAVQHIQYVHPFGLWRCSRQEESAKAMISRHLELCGSHHPCCCDETSVHAHWMSIWQHRTLTLNLHKNGAHLAYLHSAKLTELRNFNNKAPVQCTCAATSMFSEALRVQSLRDLFKCAPPISSMSNDNKSLRRPIP
jgi:hypothetical protein